MELANSQAVNLTLGNDKLLTSICPQVLTVEVSDTGIALEALIFEPVFLTDSLPLKVPIVSYVTGTTVEFSNGVPILAASVLVDASWGD